MRIIEPVTITADKLISSNIIEEAPRSASAVSYNKWSSSTSYSSSNQVCHEFTPERPDALYGQGPLFGLFTSLYSTNINHQPAKYFPASGSGTIPGWWRWTLGTYAPKWVSTTTYGIGQVVGRISGATGALYTSLVANNVGNDPVSSPSQWRQTTTDSYESYAGGTTYADGDRVARFAGTLGSVFESLVGSNTGNTPESSPTQWEYKGQAYKLWASGTAYSTGDTVTDLRTHHNYEALQSTTGNDPTDAANIDYWLDLGPNNRWAMFDTVNSSQSSYGEEIDVTFAPGEACDSLALMNMVAATARIIVTSVTGGGTVYDQTFDLADTGFITDWRHYFFDPVTYQADLIVNDLPQYVDAVVRVIISHPGDVAQCGACVVGLSNELGGTVYGASTGIIDFSRKVADDFGNYTLVERAYAKRARFKVFCLNTQIDSIQAQLARLRATPVIYQGTDDYAMTWIYGFFRDFSVDIEYPRHSYLNIEAEGLS